VRYVLDNKLIEDKDEVEELAESVGSNKRTVWL